MMTMEPEILSVTILNEQGEYYQYDRNGKTIDYDVSDGTAMAIGTESKDRHVVYLSPP